MLSDTLRLFRKFVEDVFDLFRNVLSMVAFFFFDNFLRFAMVPSIYDLASLFAILLGAFRRFAIISKVSRGCFRII